MRNVLLASMLIFPPANMLVDISSTVCPPAAIKNISLHNEIFVSQDDFCCIFCAQTTGHNVLSRADKIVHLLNIKLHIVEVISGRLTSLIR